MSKAIENIEPRDSKAIEQEYRELQPLLESFCEEITHQIVRLLEESDVTLGFPVQRRVKTWDSLSEKMVRLPRFGELKKIQDLVGLRIILLFSRDVEKVAQIIEDNFGIVKKYDTQERLKEDQFGYLSKHMVVELKNDWLTVPTLAKMSGLIAEIQIRTLAQHIWAEASHKLQYKQEKNIPPVVRRSIYRVSALLETVDLEFERVLEEREVYRSQVVEGTPIEGDEKLNVDLLETLLDVHLPIINKSLNENYASLLSSLEYFGIKSKRQLTKLIEKHLAHVIESDVKRAQELLKAHTIGIEKLPQYTLSRARKNVYLSHTGLARQMLRDEFGEKAEEYLNNGQVKEP